MRHLGRLLGQGFIVKSPSRIRIQAQVELVFPAELEARLAQRIVADLRTGVAFGKVGSVGSDLVGNDPGFHIIAVGQAQVLLGRDITEHGTAEPADHRRADTRGNVVIARSNIGGQRPQCIERRFVAALQLLVHVLLDQLHGHMTRPFNHHLNIVLPSDLGQLTEGFQLTELGFIIGIGDRTGTQAVTQREGHIIGLHDLADVLEMGIEEVLLVVCQTPLGHDRAATRDNPGDPLGSHGHVTQQHSGMDSEVVDTLLSLFDQGVAEDLPGQILSHTVDLLQGLVDGHSADRHR